MGAFIVKQPNGLLCRFSTTIWCPTSWNMTEEEYIAMCVEKAKHEAEKEAMYVISNELHPFEDMIEDFHPDVMSEERFKKALEEMSVR